MSCRDFSIVFVLCVFFFKQNTAYEMRISDWSSDVCSSDLKYLHSSILFVQHCPLTSTAKHRIMWETVWESRMGNLTVAAVKNAKPGRHSDGAGLILFVTSKKGKSRVLRAQVDRKSTRLNSSH